MMTVDWVWKDDLMIIQTGCKEFSEAETSAPLTQPRGSGWSGDDLTTTDLSS